MLLFSTMLDILPSMTKEKFIDLVIEWNRTNKYEENIIPGIKWNGEKTIRFGDDKLWLEIIDYDNENIVAVRYEKIQLDDVVWDTDYIMNFSEMKMSIQLERSYKAEMHITNAGFSTPHFISILIEAGVIASDNGLDILNKPILVDESNIGTLERLVKRNQMYKLPVIYVPKLRKKAGEDEYPVDVGWLSSRLKGVAHVLVQADVSNETLRSVFGDHFDYDGDVGIYFTNNEFKHKIRRYKKGERRRKESLEKIIDLLIRNVIEHQPEVLYTWQGVNNAMLFDILDMQKKRREEAELERDKAQSETNDAYSIFDEELTVLNKKIDELTRTNEKLMVEIYGMSSKLTQSQDIPVIVCGDEADLYPDEIKDVVLSILNDALKNCKENTRKHDVLTDLLEKNEYKCLGKSQKEEIKHIFNGYKNLSTKMKQQLEDIGFKFVDEGKHYKVIFCDDTRYQFTLAKTPSDNRTGMNIAHTISEKLF